jgi:uncharacterized membrane protein
MPENLRQSAEDPSLRRRLIAGAAAGVLAMGASHDTAKADTTPNHSEAVTGWTIADQQHLAPAPGGPRAEAASTLDKEQTTPKHIVDFERRRTGWFDALGESAFVLPDKNGGQPGAVTDWHGILGAGFEQHIGSDGNYYLLAKKPDQEHPPKLRLSFGKHIGKQNKLSDIKLIAGPRPGVLNDELVIASPSKDPKKLQEFADQAADTFMHPDEVAKLHVNQLAYGAAFPLYGKYLSDPNSPFAPDQTTRQRQSFVGNLMGLGTVNTNITQGIRSLWMSTHSSKENQAEPIGGASGSPLIVNYKHKIGVPGLFFAVSPLKSQTDQGNITGDPYTAMVAVALNNHPRGEKIGTKNSSRVTWHVEYDESKIPGYVTPAVAEAQAKNSIKQQGSKDYIKGIVSVPGLGQIKDAMLLGNDEYKLMTVVGIDPQTGEPVSKAIKYEDFILDAFNNDGSDSVSIEQSGNRIDHQQAAYIDQNGTHLGELTNTDYNGATPFKVYAKYDTGAKRWYFKSIPTKYYGAD